MWQDALRVCKEYIPHKLQHLQDEYEREMADKGGQRSVIYICISSILSHLKQGLKHQIIRITTTNIMEYMMSYINM